MDSEFRFWTASNLVILTGKKAETVGALRDLVASCPAACLFHHTYQGLRERHFVTEPYPNDFAQWVRTSVREEALGERLAEIDLRTFTSMRDLRERLLHILDDHLATNPRVSGREGHEPFFLCRSRTVTMPTDHVARDPGEMAREVRRVGIRSVYYHFVEARLRRHLATNDFSDQFKAWGMEEAARRVEVLDLYTNTLVEIRDRIAEIAEGRGAA